MTIFCDVCTQGFAKKLEADSTKKTDVRGLSLETCTIKERRKNLNITHHGQ
jgi:hypothetical protein